MAPRVEIIGPEQKGIALQRVDLGGYEMLRNTPDVRLTLPISLADDRIPHGVELTIPRHELMRIPMQGNAISRETLSELATHAVRISMPKTSMSLADDGEGTWLLTTDSSAVTAILHTFFESNDKLMYIYPNPADSESITLHVDGKQMIDDELVEVKGRVSFRTVNKPNDTIGTKHH